ncbi:MAG TPA: phosphatidylglycerophosphatase A [Balneolaceae bacterium]|nr:phosphatidylglycerophosphatase A [Balneolaceae bacterium]
MTLRSAVHSIKLNLGTLFGAGRYTKAPGTLGSLLFLPFIYGAYTLDNTFGLAILTVATCILSLWTASAAVDEFGDDPGEFIMDECAGQALVFVGTTAFGISLNFIYLLLGFLLFRLFDITKPLGIKRIEKFRGKYGILFDDLLAGIYASVGLIALLSLLSLLV